MSDLDYSKKVAPSQVKDVINDVITNSIITAIQKTTVIQDNIQELNNKCSNTAVNYVYNSTVDCVNGLKSLKASNEDIEKLCSPIYTCEGKNISITDSFKKNSNIEQNSDIENNIKNEITKNLGQEINKKVGPFDFNTVTQKIGDMTKEITNVLGYINQTINNSDISNQEINLGNFRADNISIDSAKKITSDIVQSNQTIQNIVNQINEKISQYSTQNSSSLTNIITTVFYSIVGVVLLIFVILFIIKRKDTQQFIKLLIPFIIYIVIMGVVILTLYIIKPKFIYNGKNTDKITYYSFITSIGIVLGVIIGIYYKLSSKKPKIVNKQNSKIPIK